MYYICTRKDNTMLNLKNNKTMKKSLDFFVNAVNHLQSEVFSAEMYFRMSLFELIEVMQDNEDGCVTFNDESDYPTFFDYTKDMSENVIAVRIVRDENKHSRLEGKTEDDDEWFNLSVHGRLDLSELFCCLKEKLGKN